MGGDIFNYVSYFGIGAASLFALWRVINGILRADGANEDSQKIYHQLVTTLQQQLEASSTREKEANQRADEAIRQRADEQKELGKLQALVESQEKQIVVFSTQVVELKSIVQSLERELQERDKQLSREIKERDDTFREILMELAELKERVNE